MAAALLLIALSLCARTAGAADAKNANGTVIAVLPFQSFVADGATAKDAEATAHALEDSLQAYLAEIPDLTLVERSQIDHAVAEQHLGATGAIDPASATKMGRMVKAQVIVVGCVRALGQDHIATLRAIRCADAVVVWSTELHGRTALVAGQAGTAGDELVGALQRGKLMDAGGRPEGQRSLLALRHHERARSLRAQQAYEDAVAEELLALEQDGSLAEAEGGWLEALAEAGFVALARAEALAHLAAHPETPFAVPFRGLAERRDELPTKLQLRVVDSFEARTQRELIDWLETQAVQNAPELPLILHDQAELYRAIGYSYAEQGRDRLAVRAFMAAMQRIWRLRSMDPTMFFDQPYPVPLFSAALRVTESLAGVAGHTYWLPKNFNPIVDYHLDHWVKLALQEPVPEGLVCPLRVYTLEVPILDQMTLPSVYGADASDYLFRPDWTVFPPNATILDVHLQGGSPKSVCVDRNHVAFRIQQRWVAAEADAQHARAGVPWLSSKPGSVRRGGFGDLLQAELGRGRRAQGFRIQHFNGGRDMALRVALTIPSNQDPGTLQPDALSRLEAAVFALLAKDHAKARTELEPLLSLLAKDPSLLGNSSVVKRIYALCREKP